VAGTLLESPEDSLRTFGMLLPAINEDDPNRAAAALRYATKLANDLKRWDDWPCAGSDAGILKIAKLFRARTAANTALTPWDVKAVVGAYLEALNIGPDTRLDSDAIEVRLFNTAFQLLESAWREDGFI